MAYSDQQEVTLQQIKKCCDSLKEKKAEAILVLDLKGISSVADYFVIATGNSAPQLRAMRDGVVSGLKDRGVIVSCVDAEPQSGWIVIDVFDIIVHLFLPEQRDYYSLEALWRDAKIVTQEVTTEV